MRRKDREITDFSKMTEIMKACDCCRLGLVDEKEMLNQTNVFKLFVEVWSCKEH